MWHLTVCITVRPSKRGKNHLKNIFFYFGSNFGGHLGIMLIRSTPKLTIMVPIKSYG
jgi:hypothetical protein